MIKIRIIVLTLGFSFFKVYSANFALLTSCFQILFKKFSEFLFPRILKLKSI